MSILPTSLLHLGVIVYSVKHPFGWTKMDIKKKWKVCAIVAAVGVVLEILVVKDVAIIYDFLAKFIGFFFFFTGANASTLWVQGKATFKSQKK